MKISILSLLEALSEKVVENRPPIKSNFRGGMLSHIFSKTPSKGLKIEIFTFYGSFLGILRAYFEKSHKIKLVPNSKLGLVTFLQNS